MTLEVIPNDDPYGVFSFPTSVRELTVAEDFLPGDEESTKAQITVNRDQGSSGNVMVREH